MSFKIAGSSVSIFNRNNLEKRNRQINNSVEKLSSGLRINKASDDAAGLAVSEKMRGQISGLDVAIQNTEFAANMAQVAEGSLSTVGSYLHRLRHLSVQAATDSYSLEDRRDIQDEITEIMDGIDRISDGTEYNTKKLLDGSTNAITYCSDDRLGNIEVSGKVQDTLLSITVLNPGSRHRINSNQRFEPGQTMKDFGIVGTQHLEVGGKVIDIFETDSAFDFVNRINASVGTVRAQVKNERIELEAKMSGEANRIDFGTEYNSVLHNLGLTDDLAYVKEPTNTIISITNITDQNNIYAIGRFEGSDRTFDSTEFGSLADQGGILENITVQVNDYLPEEYENVEADICFLIDTTGSMSAEINELKSALSNVVDTLRTRGVEPRFSFLAYSGIAANEDPANTLDWIYDFTDDIDVAQSNINTIGILPGGREYLHVATRYAIENLAWVNDDKYIIALTDEDDDSSITPAEITNELLASDISFSAIRNTGFGNTAADIDAVANATGGFLLDISESASALSTPIIDEIAPEQAEFKLFAKDASQNFHIGANENQLVNIGFEKINTETLGLRKKLHHREDIDDMTVDLISVETKAKAEKAITQADNALKQVSEARARLGAFQNSLVKASDFLGVAFENMSASESTIRDVDMAMEMTSLVKDQMLNQSGISAEKFIRQSTTDILNLLK